MSLNVQLDLDNLPVSGDLLQYYRDKLGKCEDDFDDALGKIDLLKVPHGETHKLHWELNQNMNEIADLQQALSDCQTALFDERKQLLKVISENDELKIQELRDRRKIRYLLSISNIPEDETTYFRDQLDKRLVRISSKPTVKRSVAVDGGEPVPTGVVRPGKENKASNGTKDVRGEQEKEQERDIVIMEDEIEALKLTVTSLRAQLSEQKKSYEETIQGLLHDRRTRMEEEKARKKYEADRIDDLTKKVEKLRVLCRENTRELLFTKKRAHTTEQKLVEEKTRLMDDVRALQNQVAEENRRNETAERVIEAKISRKHEGLVSELRSQLGKYEEDMRHIKTKSEAADLSNKKRLSYLQQRLESISSSHKSLQKRRHYEIEGFTNDILMLRKQLKTLEKTILKFGPLEDRECVLLNMAKETGDRAAKISTELQKLKHKVYEAENEMRSLAF